MKELSGIAQGVESSFDFWLGQHDLSTPDAIMLGVERAFERWLNAHAELVIERIAQEVRKREVE